MLTRPLLQDLDATVQTKAIHTLGQVLQHSEELSLRCIESGIVANLIFSLSDPDVRFAPHFVETNSALPTRSQFRECKKVAEHTLSSIAVHSPRCAHGVVEGGALDELAKLLDDFDNGVQKEAAMVLGHIAGHEEELSDMVLSSQAVSPLILSLSRSEQTDLCAASSWTIGEIAKHKPESASLLVQAGAVDALGNLLSAGLGRESHHSDVRRNACAALSHIAKHTEDLAQSVVPLVSKVVRCLGDKKASRAAATCLREIVKHSAELTKSVANESGSIPLLVHYVSSAGLEERLSGVMTLGYMAGFDADLAKKIMHDGAAKPIVSLLEPGQPYEHLEAASCWALGQMGKHSSLHANFLGVDTANCFPRIQACAIRHGASEDLHTKAKRALKGVVVMCSDIRALTPLVQPSTHPSVLLITLETCLKILEKNEALRNVDVENPRQYFVTSGALLRLQGILEEIPRQAHKGDIEALCRNINALFPPDVVKYYRGDCEGSLPPIEK
eukprot:Rmarinus@m.24735